MKTKSDAVRWAVNGTRVIRLDIGGTVCQVGGDYYDNGRRDPRGWTFDPPLDTAANAAMIAAAPELADACRLADDMLGRVVVPPKQMAALKRVIVACEQALSNAGAAR
jgi:hypothetical protein